MHLRRGQRRSRCVLHVCGRYAEPLRGRCPYREIHERHEGAGKRRIVFRIVHIEPDAIIGARTAQSVRTTLKSRALPLTRMSGAIMNSALRPGAACCKFVPDLGRDMTEPQAISMPVSFEAIGQQDAPPSGGSGKKAMLGSRLFLPWVEAQAWCFHLRTSLRTSPAHWAANPRPQNSSWILADGSTCLDAVRSAFLAVAQTGQSLDWASAKSARKSRHPCADRLKTRLALRYSGAPCTDSSPGRLGRMRFYRE